MHKLAVLEWNYSTGEFNRFHSPILDLHFHWKSACREWAHSLRQQQEKHDITHLKASGLFIDHERWLTAGEDKLSRPQMWTGGMSSLISFTCSRVASNRPKKKKVRKTQSKASNCRNKDCSCLLHSLHQPGLALSSVWLPPYGCGRC